jgi:hypothetical protein
LNYETRIHISPLPFRRLRFLEVSGVGIGQEGWPTNAS